MGKFECCDAFAADSIPDLDVPIFSTRSVQVPTGAPAHLFTYTISFYQASSSSAVKPITPIQYA